MIYVQEIIFCLNLINLLSLIMDNKKIIELLQENNKILKSIQERLDKLENSSDKMDNHIDSIMSIYQGYKKPLDYISSYFTLNTLFQSNKEINDKEK